MTEKPRELLGLVAEDFGPGPFDPIEAWEHWLCEVQDMPDSPLKDHGIEKAERMIRYLKHDLAARRHGVQWLH